MDSNDGCCNRLRMSFCGEDFDVLLGLCLHIDDEQVHPAGQRRRFYRGGSNSMILMLRKEFREGHKYSIYGGSSVKARKAEPDPLLSSFIDRLESPNLRNQLSAEAHISSEIAAGEFAESSVVAATRMFKALLLDLDNLLLKIMPDVFKSIETLQGDGGPGTVRETVIHFDGVTKRIKHRIDTLDAEKMTKSYTMTESEGDALMAKFKSVRYEITVEPTDDGGCKVKTVSNFFPKEEAQVTEDELKTHKGNSVAVFKAVESYLLANPQAYT